MPQPNLMSKNKFERLFYYKIRFTDLFLIKVIYFVKKCTANLKKKIVIVSLNEFG